MNIARSFIFLTFAEILFNLSGYVVHSAAGRLLTPAEYGRYGLIVTLSIMVVTLIGNGIPISMSKYLSQHYDQKPELVPVIKRKGLILQSVLIGGITLLFFLAAPLIAKLLRDETLTPLFRLSAFILPMYAIDSLYFYYLTGIHEFNFQSFLKISRSLLRVTVIVGLIYFWKVKGSIIGYIIVPFSVFLIAWAYDTLKLSKKFPRYSSTISFDWKKLAAYAWPITLFMIFYEILISLDLYFIKSLLGSDHATGIYNSALLLARIPYYLFYALTIILLPSVSKSTAEKNHQKTGKLIHDSLRFMFIILVPIVILLSVYAAPAIDFVFGKEYAEAVPSLQILAFGLGFLTIFYVLSFALNGAGLAKVAMKTAFWGMLLNAVLNYFFIKQYGILGSAIATSISSFSVMFFSIAYTNKNFGNLFRVSDAIKIISSGVILYLASLLFPPHNLLFILWSIILTLIYFISLYILKEIKPEDIEIFKSLLRNKKKNA